MMLLAGFVLGLQHATEADHLAAMATLASGRDSLARTLRRGVAWGIGHTLALMLFGGLVLLLGKSVPPWLDQGLQLAVALMLVGLGLDLVRRLRRQPWPVGPGPGPAAGAPLRALLVGMLHGLAGTAALILLSLGALPSVTLGLAYIALFGAGSIVGMAALSLAIALPLRLSLASRLLWLQRGITLAVGALSCGLGALMIYRSGFVNSLFTLAK